MVLARRNNDSNWISNFFDDFFDNNWITSRVSASSPAVNVKEDAEKYTMEIAAPGLKKEYCRVSVNQDGELEIKLENKMEHKDEDKKEHYLRREFSYANYEQKFALPENVDRNNISAKVNDGVLSIELPKLAPKDESKIQRQIEIG